MVLQYFHHKRNNCILFQFTFLGELLVIVEYCHYGNLHNYLLRHRGDFINQIDPITGKLDINIGSDILSKALNYDSKNRYVTHVKVDLQLILTNAVYVLHASCTLFKLN